MRTCAFGLFLGCAVLASGVAQAATVVSFSGETAADIQGTVDDYRAALGDINPFVPENFAGGRREVNWDGVPDVVSEPTAFPANGFNSGNPGTARGIEFRPSGTSTAVEVSASGTSGVTEEFGNPDGFTVFSPAKLFRSVGGSTSDTLFFDPSDQVTQATTQGLGVVFTGSESDNAPSMTYYDTKGDVLAQESVSITSPGGLAFLGVLFDDAVVARVAIDLGDAAVMDDFIYGEPSPVPLPAGLPLIGVAFAALGLLRRFRA